jgi:23S rRNA (guanosine2251-2'-O)-methyltransferase
MKILISDHVRSLHNIGSFFRICDCAGVDMILIAGKSGLPPHKDITKTALGAEDKIPWKHFETTLEAVAFAREQGCSILSLEIAPESKNIFEYDTPKNWALIVGHEVMGVDPEIIAASDECLHIPLYGAKDSLNVSVAAGVGVYALVS